MTPEAHNSMLIRAHLSRPLIQLCNDINLFTQEIKLVTHPVDIFSEPKEMKSNRKGKNNIFSAFESYPSILKPGETYQESMESVVGSLFQFEGNYASV